MMLVMDRTSNSRQGRNFRTYKLHFTDQVQRGLTRAGRLHPWWTHYFSYCGMRNVRLYAFGKQCIKWNFAHCKQWVKSNFTHTKTVSYSLHSSNTKYTITPAKLIFARWYYFFLPRTRIDSHFITF